MNVTFVYRYLTLGGVEVVLRTRAQGLAAQGIHASFWFLEDGPGRSLFEGLPVQLHVGGVGQLGEHIRSGGIEAISIIDTPEALMSVPARPSAPKVVLEVHTAYPENRAYLRLPECRAASAVFVPSSYQAHVVRNDMSEPPEIMVVPNPIPLEFEHPPVDARPGWMPPVIAWIGRLDSLKNWRGFLGIAREVASKRPDAEYWVVGAGAVDEEMAFERTIRQAGIRGRVRWWRGMGHATIPRLLDQIRSSSGVVVSTSRGESFGMAIAEAMARGCAVVVPRVGAFPDFVAHGKEGYLYRAGHWPTAADLVVRLMSDQSEVIRLGAAARERILSTHGAELALGALSDALRQVVLE